jgi:hypothetical protein
MNKTISALLVSSMILTAGVFVTPTADAEEQVSLHKKTFGTKVSGQFRIGERIFFVPEGATGKYNGFCARPNDGPSIRTRYAG